MSTPSFNRTRFSTSGQRHLGLALSQCMAIDVLSLVNPAAGAADDMKIATATVAAIVTQTAADFKAAGITKLALHGARIISFTSAAGTGVVGDVPANVAITGKDIDGNTISETLVLSQIVGVVYSVKAYSVITTLVYPAADGTGATIATGISDSFSMPTEIKVRTNPVYFMEMEDGDLVSTGGGSATATNQTKVAVNQTVVATNDALALAGHALFVAPIAAELVTIVNDVLLADGAQIIAAQPDYPRKLQVRITDGNASISAGIVTLIGIGAAGEPVTEAISLVTGTATVITADVYATLTSATVSSIAGNDGADNIGIGVGAALGLPIPSGAANVTVNKTVMDESDETVAGVDATARSVLPTTAPNAAHDYHFWYDFEVTPTQPTHNHTQDTHNHTQDAHVHAGTEATFTSPAVSAPYGLYTPNSTPDGAKDFLVVYEREPVIK